MVERFKYLLPDPLIAAIRSVLRPMRRMKRKAQRAAIYLAPMPRNGRIRVSYGQSMKASGQRIRSGGIVKFGALAESFPHSPMSFNVLYLGSSALPNEAPGLMRVARRKGAKIVWNQNGVGYPAWAPEDWRQLNSNMRSLMLEADYVFYQSEFCKISADRFLEPTHSPWEILYNPVDTSLFHPGERRLDFPPLVLLHAGTVKSYYRFEAALRTLTELTKLGIDARLAFAGKFDWARHPGEIEYQAKALITGLGLSDRVDLLSGYSRSQAPEIFRRAHILLHTKVNDPCPTVVLEAMASGLPVVYAASGGLPELVGTEAGIGVRDEATWERDIPPDPRLLAEAVVKSAGGLATYSEAARTRAVEKFDVSLWVKRHREVFSSLL